MNHNRIITTGPREWTSHFIDLYYQFVASKFMFVGQSYIKAAQMPRNKLFSVFLFMNI